MSTIWRISINDVPEHAVGRFEAALGPMSQSVSGLEQSAGLWRVSGICNQRPDHRHFELPLALAAAAADIPLPEVVVEPVADQDWVAHGLRTIEPVRIGRFFVYGSHAAQPVPAGSIGLKIDAGMAFGTGHHASTAGCLLALSGFHHCRVRRALDMGCGSGVLAIAAAKIWHTRVLAVDVDPDAVAEAKFNARINGVVHRVRSVAANGYSALARHAAGSFDAVVSNILARPLKRMAPGLARALAPGGVAIVAGFIHRDAADVAAVHRAFGLSLTARIETDGWTTLVLVKQDGKARKPAGVRPGFCSLARRLPPSLALKLAAKN